MRIWRGIVLLVVATCPALAEDRGRRSGLDIVVPVDPRPHEDVYWFGGTSHHAVPGTVAIDRDPYVCDLDGGRFRSSEALVAHAVGRHGVAAADIGDRLVAVDGVLHFTRPR